MTAITSRRSLRPPTAARLGLERARQHRNRQQFHDVPAAADDAIEEPGPAQPDGHQPVHPATGRIRRGRAANEVERLVEHPGVAGAEPRNDARRSLWSARPWWSTARPRSSPTARRPGALNVTKPATATITITDSTGQTAYTGTAVNAGSQNFVWDGRGNNGTWPDGTYTMTATGRRQRPVDHRLDPGPGQGRFGRSHADAAGAVDQRAELHGQPDPAHRRARALNR